VETSPTLLVAVTVNHRVTPIGRPDTTQEFAAGPVEPATLLQPLPMGDPPDESANTDTEYRAISEPPVSSGDRSPCQVTFTAPEIT